MFVFRHKEHRLFIGPGQSIRLIQDFVEKIIRLMSLNLSGTIPGEAVPPSWTPQRQWTTHLDWTFAYKI